jgi:hypothetical protein
LQGHPLFSSFSSVLVLVLMLVSVQVQAQEHYGFSDSVSNRPSSATVLCTAFCYAS